MENSRFKFRAWHRGVKEMIYPSGTSRQGDVFHWFAEGQPIEIMQFTGLHDKNGKEIYEGDIVLYEDHEWVVVWDYDRWDMMNGDKAVRDDDLMDDPGFTSWELCNIIGNLYENPELLKS